MENAKPKKDLGCKWKCEKCLKSYKYKKSLVEHMRLHTGENPNTCDLCGKKFYYKRSLWYHTKRMVCTQVKLRKDPDDKFMCGECGELFNHRWDWLKHGLLHTGKNPYKCSNCHKSFYYSADLQKHIEDKVCIKEYSKEDLNYKYKCEECGKSYKYEQILVEHRRLHTMEKPYSCGRCGKKFSHKDSHWNHMRHMLCKQVNLQVLEERVEVQRGDLANPEHENHPMTAEEHYQNAENNIQPTLVLNPKFSQDPSFHKQTAQHGPLQDQSCFYVPYPGHSEGDINIEQEQGKNSFLDQDSTQLDLHILLDNLNQLTAQTHLPLKLQTTQLDSLLNLKIKQSSIPLIQPTEQHASPIRQQTVLNSSQDQSSSGYLEGDSNRKCQQEEIDSSFVLQSNLLTFYSEWSDMF